MRMQSRRLPTNLERGLPTANVVVVIIGVTFSRMVETPSY